MKVNNKFIDILAEKKFLEVGEIIEEMNFLKFENNTIKNLDKKYKILEQIFYTVYFLEKEKLIITEHNYKNTVGPNINMKDFVKKYKSGDIIFRRLNYIDELIKEYWHRQIRITLNFYSFIDNKYKTDKQKGSQRNFWLAIGIAVLASILTGLSTKLFDLII